MKKETRRVTRVALSLLLVLAVLVPATNGASALGRGGWRHVGNDAGDKLNGSVYTFNTDAPDVLYVGGTFYDAGGHSDADYIASWNGQDWSALGAPPLSGPVHAIEYHDGKVYAGGVFTNAGANPNADFLAVWDGVAWAPPCTAVLSGPAIGGNVEALEIIGNTLYVGGSFHDGGGIASADSLLACDLTTGASRSTVPADHHVTSTVHTMDSDSDGNLYVGGGFHNMAGNLAADNVAYLDPAGVWHEMGASGVDNNDGSTDWVRALTVAANDDVYVSTDGLNVAGIAQADHVARWDGSAWSAMGANTAGDNGWFSTTTYIYGMTTFGDAVFVTGSFQDANGNRLADNVAVFDGTAWKSIGSDGAGNGPWIGEGAALTTLDDKLYAGGSFTSAGGDTNARGVASFRILRPDAVIHPPHGINNWLGDDVYNTTAQGQTIRINQGRGVHNQTIFDLLFHNDGLIEDELLIRATGQARGFRVRYLQGSPNSGPEVDLNQGVLQTILPGAHGTPRLFMEVRISARSARSASFLIRTRSSSQPGAWADAVRVVITAG